MGHVELPYGRGSVLATRRVLHQFNLSPNCICRSLVCVGLVSGLAVGITLPEPSKIFVFGAWKFGLLKRLKASARNWSFALSCPRDQFLKSEKSYSSRPGPRGVLRLKLPSVPSAGQEKHSVL